MGGSPGEGRSLDPALASQAAYYLVTGIWPIVHERSFQAVTGPKASMWLVKTFGALTAAVGLALGVAARTPRSPEARVLGLGAAAAIGAADCIYVVKGRIAPTYLVDASAQAILAACLLASEREGAPRGGDRRGGAGLVETDLSG
jgi:hypothetical protein